jgi:uncharacterized protein involved in tolerance to divalent cations
MGSDKPLVYVVVEKPHSEDYRVKTVFKSKDAAREAIAQEFTDLHEYDVVPRTLHESMTD